MTTVFRAATHSDRNAVRALVDDATAETGYRDAPLYFFQLAFGDRPSEARVIIAERDGAAVGCALFGEVAGAVGTGRIQFVAVAASARRCGLGAGLCDAACGDLAARGARCVVAELPDDATLTAGRAMLAHCGFVEAARVADYYRDGVDQAILQRTVPSPR